MDKETKLLEAHIKSCRWSDFHDRYGAVGMELIGEFIACGGTSLYDENDKIINVMTIPELMEVLTKYCKGEK